MIETYDMIINKTSHNSVFHHQFCCCYSSKILVFYKPICPQTWGRVIGYRHDHQREWALLRVSHVISIWSQFSMKNHCNDSATHPTMRCSYKEHLNKKHRTALHCKIKIFKHNIFISACDIPVWLCITVIGTVCTIYTTIVSQDILGCRIFLHCLTLISMYWAKVSRQFHIATLVHQKYFFN